MNARSLERVLRRKSIPRGQLTLLKHLYERDGDEWVSSSELVDRIRWGDEARFPGVVGAFGNRINATPEIAGEPGSSAFLERNRIDGETHYRLRPEARAAIEAIDVLLETFERRSMAELLEPGTEIDAAKLASDEG